MSAASRALGVCGLAAAWVLALAPAALAQRVAEIQVAPPYLRMVPDAQAQISATAYDTTGTPLNVKFRWTSSNVNVAVIDSNGMVRAVAPGSALITALPLDQPRGRRRAGQVTVRVVPPGVSTAPSAPSAAAPGAPAAPAAPPIGAPMPVTPQIPRPPAGAPLPGFMTDPRARDSMLKASVDCSEAMMNATNPMRACYDQRPSLHAGQAPLSTTCRERTGGIMLLLRVDTAGNVAEVRPFVSSRCPAVTDSVVATARLLSFRPATRAGQPIEAWVRLLVRSLPVESPHPPPPTRP